MEDIDDLLDEVETKYVKKNKSVSNGVTAEDPNNKTNPQKPNKAKKKLNSAIDAAIDDILDLDLDGDHEVLPSNSKSQHAKLPPRDETNRKKEQARRCLPVYLGGSECEVGVGSAVNKRTCDQLRCTSCDFRISTFNNMAWKKDTDYLFLRNNVPDFEKLKPKLIRKKGWRAYCCQCCWRNILELCELTDPDLKWVCGKHFS